VDSGKVPYHATIESRGGSVKHHNQIVFGNWDEVSRRHASELEGHRVEIRVLDDIPVAKPPKQIFEGMYPQLTAITEADFMAAEWCGPMDGHV